MVLSTYPTAYSELMLLPIAAALTVSIDSRVEARARFKCDPSPFRSEGVAKRMPTRACAFFRFSFCVSQRLPIKAYTRVLQGHIGLATSTFPDGTPGFMIDAFARRHLWDAGLDYQHGTGHGVGAALNVHEGPHVSHICLA